MPTVKPINQLATSTQLALIFVTIILGIIWQGGALFWFGPAAFSAFILFLFYFYRSYQRRVSLPHSSISRLFILFTLWCFITVAWSDAPSVSLIRSFTIGASVLGLYSYFFMTSRGVSWQQIWNTVTAVGLVLFIYSCIEIYLGINPPNSLFFNKNTHAAYLNLIILPSAAYFLISAKSNKPLIPGLILFALIFSHALPGSRGATAGQIIGLMLILFVGRHYFTRARVMQLLGIYATAMASATLLTSNLLRFFEYEVKDVDLGRMEIWTGAWNLWKDTPWYGGGIGTYWLTHPAYRNINETSSGQNAHNDYLQFLIEAGIPGLILLLLIIIGLVYIWVRYINRKDLGIELKIEVTGLIAAITSIGFHSFFTFNLGVFSILYLTGLLTGRLLDRVNQSKSVVLLENLPIRKNIFRLTSLTVLMIFSSYFTVISIFSHLYTTGETAYIDGDISQADQLVSTAMAIYPYDDRPYLFYVQTFVSVLSKMKDMPEEKKHALFKEAMGYLGKARLLNPLRETSYYLEARLYEQLPQFAGSNWQQKVIDLYQQSLKTNPRFLKASHDYAQFLISQGKYSQAEDVVYKAITYYYYSEKKTLDFYNFAEKILALSNEPQRLELLTEKKGILIKNLEKAEKNR